MDICRELLNFATTDSVNEASLTDTVSANETILFTLDESHACVIEQSFSANNNCDACHIDVFFEAFAHLMTNLRFGNSLLVCTEFGYLLIKSILGLSLSLSGLSGQLTGVELRVLIGLTTIDTCEGVEEVFITDDVALG